MTNKSIVEFNNVFHTSDRGEPIFEDLNLSVTAGRSVVISGAAGSGKTTLIELLLGLKFADSGAVELFGETLKRGRRHRRPRRHPLQEDHPGAGAGDMRRRCQR